MALARPSEQFCSQCDEACQTWRGRGKQPVQDQSAVEPAVDSVHDGADEEQAYESIHPEAEDQRAPNDIVSCARRTWQHIKKDPDTSPKIPRTSIGILRTPQASRQTTPRTSRQVTPHTSRPGTPRVSRPATPYNSVASSLSAGYQANTHLISKWSGTPGHLPSTPPISRAKTPGYALMNKPRTFAQLPSFPPPTKLNAHALRHARSTPHLPKRHPLSPLPASWPPTTTQTALALTPNNLTPNPPSRNRAYTHPPRLFLKTATRKPSTTTNLTTTTTTSLPSYKHPHHSSICIHTNLFLYYSHSSGRQKIVPSGRRYRCTCKWSKHSTLRSQRSQLSFQWVDGAVQVSYPDAPEKAEWCYCLGGEGHVVQSAGEAVRFVAEEKRSEMLAVTMREVEDVERGPAGVDRESAARTGRLSEAQRGELDEAEWRGTKKALTRQRDCLWLRARMKRWLLYVRMRRVTEKGS